jgi:hypothetical protein
MIAKNFFTAKDIRRIGTKILRDHGTGQLFPSGGDARGGVPLTGEVGVQRRASEQGRVVTELGAGAVEDQDPLGAAGRGDTVRDHDERAAAARERRLGLFLRGRVEMAGRLVEDDEPRGRQVRAGERNELPFARGEGGGGDGRAVDRRATASAPSGWQANPAGSRRRAAPR